MHEPLTPDVLATVRAFLAGQSTAALATVDESGAAQAAPVFFSSDDALNLYWLSSPGSRHSLNLAARPRVAATVYADVWMWQTIRGVQIEGDAALLAEMTEERAAILRGYRQKFRLPPEMDALITASSLYVLRPRWLRWLDNGVRFGFRAEGPLGG